MLPPKGRIQSLDGLRGVAALVVVVTHAVLAGIAYMAYEPRLFATWVGEDAVAVFFVLSGFVLTLPIMSGSMKLRSYYPSRFVRLYLPVWAALVLAAILHSVTNWHHIDGVSWWLNVHASPLKLRSGIRNATLYKAGGYSYTESLWSLYQEVLFSLLLPIYVLIGRSSRRFSLLVGIAALALLVSGASSYTRYLPIFLLGTLLAFHVETLRHEWSRGHPLIRVAGVVLIVACCTAGAWAPLGSAKGGVEPMLEAIAAAGIVSLAIASKAFDRWLTIQPVKWLGRRSYGLYLVQEPVVVSVAYLMGGKPNTVLYIAIALIAALLVAEVFYRLVERPSHLLSRRVKRWAAAPG